MKRIFLTLIVLLIATLKTHSQTDFRAGYVINLDGDTLFGEIDYRANYTMNRVCRFRKDKIDTISRFYPDDILAYRFINSKYYISKQVNGSKVFLEYLVNSRIRFYYMVDSNLADHYYFEKDSFPLTELPYYEEIKSNEEVDYLYKSNKHIGILRYYLQDAVGLDSEIELIKRPDHKNLIAIALKYNKIVCNDTNCIIYEKKLPPLKVDFEIIGGIFSINEYADLTDIPITGIITHFWLPRISENLYLKTGILGVKTKTNGKNTIGLSFPFQVGYIYPKGIIRPKFAFGMNSPFMTFNLSPGINIKVLKSVYLSLNSDFGFIPDSYLSDQEHFKVKFLSKCFYAGIYFKL